jgi:hypothetical protein
VFRFTASATKVSKAAALNSGKKNPPWWRVQGTDKKHCLFDLRFFVHHMLSNDRVVFLDFHLSRGVLFVFVGRVKVTGTGGRYQADFISCALGHGLNPPLYFFAA